MKQKILYIDHEFHKKTKSNLFLVDLLKEKYDVEYITFDPDNNVYNCSEECYETYYDSLLLFQVIVDVEDLKSRFHCGNLVYVPMYDGTGELPDSFWISYKDFNIINFSQTLHKRLQSKGFSTNYIQYFPKPAEFVEGEENTIYFWQRIPSINLKVVLDLLRKYSINKIHIHAVMDPGNKFFKPDKDIEEKYNIEYSKWYNTKAEMIEDMKKYSIYIAPREFEGIGMSFLEAMSFGKVVIAPNHPTMNEYIKSGQNGFLYEMKNIQEISRFDLKKIQKNTYMYMCEGYDRWQKNKVDILRWVMEAPKIDQNLMAETIKNAHVTSKHYLFSKILILTCEQGNTYKLFGKIPISPKIANLLFQIYSKVS